MDYRTVPQDQLEFKLSDRGLSQSHREEGINILAQLLASPISFPASIRKLQITNINLCSPAKLMVKPNKGMVNSLPSIFLQEGQTKDGSLDTFPGEQTQYRKDSVGGRLIRTSGEIVATGIFADGRSCFVNFGGIIRPTPLSYGSTTVTLLRVVHEGDGNLCYEVGTKIPLELDV
jgi:hypothetical protein